MVEQRIFRQYDIRGVWGKDLTTEAVMAIGRAFSFYLSEKLKSKDLTVTIGRDVRKSSPAIFDALSEAFASCGVNVIDLGTCPTPLQYFSLFNLKVDGGVMITGSHNPPEFNGMKLSLGKETLFGEQIQEIGKLAAEGASLKSHEKGKTEKYDIIKSYSEYINKNFGDFSGIKAVVDAGNGTAGVVAPALLKAHGADVIELYCEPDGNFPNHHPDPVVLENIKDLIATVKSAKAHVGIGYDGDADRLGVVDEEGNTIWGDRLLIIFARDILKTNPGASIIGEVKCSQTLYDDIKTHGGNPIMWKTGHSLIKKKMRDEKAMLAGEMSGHIFFADRYFGYDDAVYASMRLLEIMHKNGPPYSVKRLLEGVPESISTPELRVDCPDETKFDVVEKAKNVFKEFPIIDIDGLRINFPDGWGLIRASNTQPALVLRFEAKSEEALKRIRNHVEGELKKLL